MRVPPPPPTASMGRRQAAHSTSPAGRAGVAGQDIKPSAAFHSIRPTSPSTIWYASPTRYRIEPRSDKSAGQPIWTPARSDGARRARARMARVNSILATNSKHGSPSGGPYHLARRASRRCPQKHQAFGHVPLHPPNFAFDQLVRLPCRAALPGAAPPQSWRI